MSIFVTKSILSKIASKIEYPSSRVIKEDESYTNEPWSSIVDLGKRVGSFAHNFICRICAKYGSVSINERINGYNIMAALGSITNIIITAEDSLPKYICSDCLEMLRVAINFKVKCEDGDRKFRRILHPMGDPSFYSYPYSKHDFQSILNKMKRKKQRIDEERREKMQQRKREQTLVKSGRKVKHFKCSTCDLTFKNKAQLVAHQRERQCMLRACDICGELVLNVRQHMRHFHKQKILHKCPTCGKGFPVIARLKTHMVVHTNTFKFSCDLCPYRCKLKHYLVTHMRTHTGEKPYKCTECNSTFVNVSNLNKHKLIHQEKQYKCEHCGKTFRTISTMREHHGVAHMNIKHTCSYCGRDFCYRSDLRKHEIRSHNRTKREYKGAEPTYKQVERLAKAQDAADPVDKWRPEVMQQPQTVFEDQDKQFLQAGTGQTYFPDVAGLAHQPQIAQQTVEIFPDLALKKDNVNIYEAHQQSIGYF